MSFIYEPIPEADKQRIDFEKQASEFPGFASKSPFSWFVDRDRDVQLICHGLGRPDQQMPALFAFYYKELGLVALEILISDRSNTEKSGRVLIHQIAPIFWRPQFDEYKDDIRHLIKEALTAFGRTSPSVTDVEVEFKN